MKVELQNIQNMVNAELPPNKAYLLFTACCSEPADKLQLVKNVMVCIAGFAPEKWPKDSEWEKILPSWFIQKIKMHSLEEIIANPVLWDFSSWVEAMKYRGWHWFSSSIFENGFNIVLDAHSQPYSVDPLEYVLIETGISLKNIKFEDFYTTNSP